MQKLDRKIVLVTRKTRLEDMVVRNSTRSMARFRVTQQQGDWSDFESEHTLYQQTVDTLHTRLQELCRVAHIERSFLPTYVFGPQDVIICIGQDGLVANTLKYTDGQYVMGVNPEPKRFDGLLLGWTSDGLDALVNDAERALQFKLEHRAVSMAEACLSDGQVLRAVNDIFIGIRSHSSARYKISHRNLTERQSSSGVIITTGMGSTAWMKSILNTASTLMGSIKGQPAPPPPPINLPWDARELLFAVREAFPSKWTKSSLVFGRVLENEPVRIISEMPESGIIFSDGMEKDAIEFNSPLSVVIGLAKIQSKVGWPTPSTAAVRRSKRK
ncbi:MAG: sugar kinase [Verrucomicrobiota bacterium]|nr:sugar kinase [Verrucomicrobiota bacterium]